MGLSAVSQRCSRRGPDLLWWWETFCVYKPQQSSWYQGHLETAGTLAGTTVILAEYSVFRWDAVPSCKKKWIWKCFTGYWTWEQDPRVVGLSMWPKASDVLLIFTKYHPKLKSEALEWGPTCLHLLPSSHVHWCLSMIGLMGLSY